MIYIFLILSLIAAIIFLVLLANKKKSIFWNLFFGIIISRFIIVYPLYNYLVSDSDIDLSSGLFTIVFLGFLIVNSIILLIPGCVIKSKINKNHEGIIKTNYILPIVIVIYILATILFSYVIPNITEDKKTSPISKGVVAFLEEKYGDHNYKVKKVEKNYSYNGFVQKNHKGYKVYVTSDFYDGSYPIDTDLDGNVKETAWCNDSILEDYIYSPRKYVYDSYSGDYKSPDNSYKIDIGICDYSIPDNLGHLPSVNELIENDWIDYISIYISEDKAKEYEYDIDGRINYMGKIITKVMDDFEITKDAKFKFCGISTFYYNIQKNKNTLIMNEQDTNIEYIYEINRNILN